MSKLEVSAMRVLAQEVATQVEEIIVEEAATHC